MGAPSSTIAPRPRQQLVSIETLLCIGSLLALASCQIITKVDEHLLIQGHLKTHDMGVGLRDHGRIDPDLSPRYSVRTFEQPDIKTEFAWLIRPGLEMRR